MAFDPTKPVQTRDGRPARIICTDRKDDGWPIVAIYADNSAGRTEGVGCYTREGRFGDYGSDNRLDLVNVPVEREGYVVLYPHFEYMSNWAAAHKVFVGKSVAEKAAAKIEGGIVVPIKWQE